MTFEETLAKLCNLNGISGDESEVASFIIEQIEDYCDEVRVDNMGSVIALKKGAKTPAKKIMLDAHMDEVGMIVTGFTADGGLTLPPWAGWIPGSSSGGRCWWGRRSSPASSAPRPSTCKARRSGKPLFPPTSSTSTWAAPDRKSVV